MSLMEDLNKDPGALLRMGVATGFSYGGGMLPPTVRLHM